MLFPKKYKSLNKCSAGAKNNFVYAWLGSIDPNHELQKSIETKSRYLLLVKWQTLEDHTIGFRQSAEHQQWKVLLHHFYEPFPKVEHYQVV
ncbi:MAG: hypothetical protein ACJASL_003544 [Paraglaciecola sp.]|jgi:hypothetical protein